MSTGTATGARTSTGVATGGTPRTDAGTTVAKSGRTTVDAGSPGHGTPAALRGRTTIADGVVEKIAGMAAREVPGVYALGGGLARRLGAVRGRVPGGGRSAAGLGVKVEVGERQTAVDLDIVVEYGVPITEVAGDIRESVISAVERMTGLEVVEVNVAVVDVRLPGDETEADDEGDGSQSRVR
ncbi:Asp23/Gls24 family envelope stress response protein [Streptomyces sp. MST-110588]|nr:Asp23/Gls24 family envelope stress response protein [Streptomyces sp. MST-110588]